MSESKTLKIFLLDGEPTGTKIVEMSNWTGKAFIIPRKKIKNILQRKELNSQAVYFLIGENEEGDQSVYVGEAEEFKKRILQHNNNKDFWNSVICFISKDDNLTKAHVKYIEAVLIEEINKAKRIIIENGNQGGIPKLPESDEADMKTFLNNLRTILTSLGFVFLEDLTKVNEELEEIYFVSQRGANATIKLTNEGYVLQPGSTIVNMETPGAKKTILQLRKKYLTYKNVAKKDENLFELLTPLKFTSPSTVASFVIGHNVNGWEKLKDKNGKTLDSIKRQPVYQEECNKNEQ